MVHLIFTTLILNKFHIFESFSLYCYSYSAKMHTGKLDIYTSSVVETRPTWRTFQIQA